MNETKHPHRRHDKDAGVGKKHDPELHKRIVRLERENKALSSKLKIECEKNRVLEGELKYINSKYHSPSKDDHDARSVLMSILESTIEYSIIAMDLKGKIIFWNKGAEYNYGYAAEEVEKKLSINILHTPEDVKAGKVQEFLDTAIQKGKADGVFDRIRKDNTRFIASVNVSLRKNEIGIPIGFVLISKDITESKQTEAQLLKSNEELEQFAYITSHDLKAPLRAIERLATWIEEDNFERLDQRSKDNLGLLKQRTHRMGNLIDGILQYSRAGRTDLDLHQIDTNELLKEVVDSIAINNQFVIEWDQNMPKFTAAKVPLSQVFTNLINNGIKHHHLDHGTIHIGCKDLGNFYQFYVQDDGPGIEELYFDKIFMIFQTLKSRDEFEATGIGLSIVKKIVESQHGKVTIESQVGKGTTFFFTWPKYPKLCQFSK